MKLSTTSTGVLAISALAFSYYPVSVYANTLDNIVITASKREQLLSQADASITVKTGDEIEKAGVTKIAELDKVFSGLVIRTRGNRAYSNISIRGVTSPDFYNPAVQVYIDGVPQDVAVMDQQLQNVERVELMRGPQGTLYGRNAHGGVINIITRKIADQAEGRVTFTLANEQKESDLLFSSPLGNSGFSTAISFRFSREDGQINDIATGRNNINESESKRAQIRLRYNPESSLTSTLDISREELYSYEEIYLKESLFDQQYYDSSTQGPKSLLDREVNTYALNLKYELDGATISSTTAFQDRYMDRILFGLNYPEQQETLSQEVRIALTPNDHWDGVFGLYYQKANFQRDDPGFPGYYGSSINQVDSISYALFGEATYQLNDTWDITLGARWSKEEADINFSRVASFNFKASDSFTDVSPKLALGWQYSENTRLYLSATRGFKPGGFNHAISSPTGASAFDSETSTNLELGWRTEWADRNIQLSGSLYHIAADDKQIYVGPLGAQYISNLGATKSYGLEAELQWKAAKDTQIGLAVNWGKSKFKQAADPNSGQSYTNKTLPYAPDLNINLHLEQHVQQSIFPGDLTIYASARYVDELYFNEANTLKQNGYTLLDVSANLITEQGFDLRLFIDNLGDERYRTSSFMFGSDDVRSTISEGRLVGLTAAMNF